MVSCGNDVSKDTTITFENKLKIAQSNGISTDENIPEWLEVKIQEIETMCANDIFIIKTYIFKCEWKEQTIYFIANNLASCALCEVYYKDGGKVIFSEEDIISDSFCETSKNWVLVYEYGDGIDFNWIN